MITAVPLRLEVSLASWLIALVAGLTAFPASAERPARVALISATDATGTLSNDELASQLEAALLQNGAVVGIPRSAFVRSARKYRIPRKDWLKREPLETIAIDAGIDYVLVARMTALTNWSFQLEVVAVKAGTSTVIAREVERLPLEFSRSRSAPVLGADRMREIIARVARRLPQVLEPARKSAPPTDDTTPPTEGSGFSDPGFGSGFDSGTGDTSDGESGSDSGNSGFSVGFGDVSSVGEVLTELEVDVGGKVGAEHFAYPVDLVDPPPDHLVRARNQVELEIALEGGTDDARAKGNFVVRHDFADPSRAWIAAREAYADLRLGWFSMRGGLFTVTWGTASLYNPTDVINPRDALDFLDLEKRGSLALRGAVGAGPFYLEAYWLALPEPSLVPLPTGVDDQGEFVAPSRWIVGGLPPTLPDGTPLKYRFTDRGPPPPGLENSGGATRAVLSLFGMDLSLGYATLIDHSPSFRGTVVADAALPTVEVETFYPRRHYLTTDFQTAFGGLRLAAEGVAAITGPTSFDDPASLFDDPASSFDDPDVINPHYVAGVVGADYQTPQFFETHSMHFFLETAAATGLLDPLPEDLLSRSRLPFRLALLTKADYRWGTVLAMGARTFVLFDGMDFVGNPSVDELMRYDVWFAPEVSALLFDRIRVRMAADVLVGQSDLFFGAFTRNSRLRLSMEAHF